MIWKLVYIIVLVIVWFWVIGWIWGIVFIVILFRVIGCFIGVVVIVVDGGVVMDEFGIKRFWSVGMVIVVSEIIMRM